MLGLRIGTCLGTRLELRTGFGLGFRASVMERVRDWDSFRFRDTVRVKDINKVKFRNSFKIKLRDCIIFRVQKRVLTRVKG